MAVIAPRYPKRRFKKAGGEGDEGEEKVVVFLSFFLLLFKSPPFRVGWQRLRVESGVDKQML